MQTLSRFCLVLCGLSAYSENTGVQGFQFLVMIAEATCLWRATARARDDVPTIRRRNTGAPSSGVNINYPASSQAPQVHHRLIRAREDTVGQERSGQM